MVLQQQVGVVELEQRYAIKVQRFADLSLRLLDGRVEVAADDADERGGEIADQLFERLAFARLALAATM